MFTYCEWQGNPNMPCRMISASRGEDGKLIVEKKQEARIRTDVDLFAFIKEHCQSHSKFVFVPVTNIRDGINMSRMVTDAFPGTECLPAVELTQVGLWDAKIN